MVSVRRVAPVLLFVIALPAFAQRQSSTPPRELHRVGDHYTAYNPPDPATYSPGVKTHKIKSGDTLWALAETYFGNAYLWPQLWESNTWITDAHWIYPGDLLLIEGEGTGQTADASTAAQPEDSATLSGGATEVETETTSSGIPVARIQQESRPIPLGNETDIYCYGYIGAPNEIDAMPNFVESLEDVEVMYMPRARIDAAAQVAEGDLVYIRGGAGSGLVAGETYIAVEPGDLIRHPHTGELIGRHYSYQGQIRILCTDGEQSRAMIVQSCREISVGARLKPLPQLPIPIARVPDMPAWCDPPTGRSTGAIIDSRDWDLELAEGVLVQVNLGADDRLQPGDFLTVYRPSPRADQPRQVLGEIGILTTQSRTATGIIVQARRTMQIGDYVEAR